MKFIQPEWPAPLNIKAYTTVRSYWGKKGVAQENLDSPQLESLLNLPAEPIWLTQKHTAIAIPALPENKEKIADASFTKEKNRICIVTTADCLPVLICHQEGTHVAAIHAGWRGLASGIIDSTLACINVPPEDLLIWLGPAIGPCKFEVGQDVYDAFTVKNNECIQSFKQHKEGKWLANLYDLAKIQLKKQGVKHIYGGNFCTYSQEDLFFSYRRDKGLIGRMASLIWISS